MYSQRWQKKKGKKKEIILIVGVTPEGSRRNNVRPHPTVALSTMSSHSTEYANIYSRLYRVHSTVFRRIELSKKS